LWCGEVIGKRDRGAANHYPVDNGQHARDEREAGRGQSEPPGGMILKASISPYTH
jgi:hypothetical protein